METEKRYLNTDEAANYLGLSNAQLEKARTQGRGGPPYLKPPGVRRILYDRVSLDNWMQEGQRINTAEPEPSVNYPKPKPAIDGGNQ